MIAPGCLKSQLAPIVDMYTQLTLHQLVRHPEASRTWHPRGGRAVGGVRGPARAAGILDIVAFQHSRSLLEVSITPKNIFQVKKGDSELTRKKGKL